MKPNWKDAPSWANWLYISALGNWVWSEFKPDWDRDRECYLPPKRGKNSRAIPTAESSLEARPDSF